MKMPEAFSYYNHMILIEIHAYRMNETHMRLSGHMPP